MALAAVGGPAFARVHGLQCIRALLPALLVVSCPPLVCSDADGRSASAVSVSLGAESDPSRMANAEVDSAYGPWALALVVGLIGLWLLMPAPRPASSEQEMKSRRAEKFGAFGNQARPPPKQPAATAAPTPAIAAKTTAKAATATSTQGSNIGLARECEKSPIPTADRHFFVNGQVWNPGLGTSAFGTPSRKANSASQEEVQNIMVLPSTPAVSSPTKEQAAQKRKDYVQDAKEEAPSTISASQPAVVERKESGSLKVRLRFMAGAQDVEVDLDASWTVARWTKEVSEMPHVRSKSSTSSLELVFAGRVLGQTPHAVIGKLLAGPGVPVVLVVERRAAAAASSTSRAASSAAASSSASGSARAASRAVTVSRQEAADRLWASLGLRWARSQNRSLPTGAAACGYAAAGGPLYLARGRHAGGMVIGEVGAGLGGCRAAFGEREVVLSDYEVLCMDPSQNGVRMRFASPLQARREQVPAGAVPLGWEADGVPLYGSRAAHAGGLHLGKMRPGLGCRITYAGAEVRVPNFEVLCFGSDALLERPLPVEGSQGAAAVATARRVSECSSGGSSSSGSSSGGSSSGSESGDDELLGVVASFGVPVPMPSCCRMNDMVEAARRELPQAILECLPRGSEVTSLKKRSDGWHEGYEVALRNAPVPRAFCRIWRSEVAYHRLEVPVGPEIELKAMELARAAGLPTPQLLERGAGLSPAVGTCNRGDTRPASFALFTFVEGAASERAASKAIDQSRPRWIFELSLMVKLHQYRLGAAEATAPLARFDSWKEQLDYLANLAAFECGGAGRQAAVAASAVQRMFEEAHIPELPPALCHLDWHLGNVLVSSSGELLAVLDWEFAGISDPRFDLARYVRRECFRGDALKCQPRRGPPTQQDIWEQYSQLRFGQAAGERLGPLEPWLALESLAVLVFASVLCARTAAAGNAAGAAGPQEGNYVPRCDLMEWVEDMQTALYHLRRLALVD